LIYRNNYIIQFTSTLQALWAVVNVGTACSNTEQTLWFAPQYYNKQLSPSTALFSNQVQWKRYCTGCTKPLINYYVH